MPVLTAMNLLDCWESGLDSPWHERALLLLKVVNPEVSDEDLLSLPIGQRDARLIALRESVFGTSFISLVKCPACRENVELSFTSGTIMATTSTATERLTLNAEGYELNFRLPNTADLFAITSMKGIPDLRRELFLRCLISAVRTQDTAPPADFPAELIATVSDRMALADPQADIQLFCTCPACTHEWRAMFDIVAFLWSELHAWAVQLLGVVHKLAHSYGWSERDILAMSAKRRHVYLDLLEA